MKKITILILAICSVLQSQNIAYVDSKYILEKIPDFESAQEELNAITLEWQEEIDIDGNPTTVDMFLYGRVALVYLTPNGKAATYNRSTGSWEALPGKYVADIQKAIRVAQAKAQQEVLFAPIQKFQVQ